MLSVVLKWHTQENRSSDQRVKCKAVDRNADLISDYKPALIHLLFAMKDYQNQLKTQHFAHKLKN